MTAIDPDAESVVGRAGDTAEAGMTATASADTTTADDHAYFQAIETVFIALRGAPLLLAPADWRIAQQWRAAGIPLGVVERALHDMFEKRRAQGKTQSVRGLRYCRPAVEAAWTRMRDLQAPAASGHGPVGEAIEVPERLARLAACVETALGPEGADLAVRVRALAGEAEAVEARLTALDGEMLRLAAAALDEATRHDLATQLAAAQATLAQRLPRDAVAQAADRLFDQLLRSRTRLPLLSLFSPEASAPP